MVRLLSGCHATLLGVEMLLPGFPHVEDAASHAAGAWPERAERAQGPARGALTEVSRTFEW